MHKFHKHDVVIIYSIIFLPLLLTALPVNLVLSYHVSHAQPCGGSPSYYLSIISVSRSSVQLYVFQGLLPSYYQSILSPCLFHACRVSHACMNYII